MRVDVEQPGGALAISSSVTQSHMRWTTLRAANPDDAKRAEEEFNRIFKRKEMPEEIKTVETEAGSLPLAQFLAKTGLAASVAEAKRLIEQGGVRISGVRQTEPNVVVGVKTGDDFILQVGKRRFLRVRGK